MKKIKYTTVEELLLSDGFLKWYQQTDGKEAQEWDEWISEDPEHERLAKEAIEVIQLITEVHENKIEKQETSAATNRLTDTIRSMKKVANQSPR